jgi:tumor protein p53-inducible protein 3
VGEGEVLIKVLASSVNRIDSMQANGKYPAPAGVTTIGGLDCAGYVVDPKTLEPVNDHLVMSLLNGGAYAQYATSPKDLLIAVPKNLKVQEAASIPEVWLTAYQLLKMVL